MDFTPREISQNNRSRRHPIQMLLLLMLVLLCRIEAAQAENTTYTVKAKTDNSTNAGTGYYVYFRFKTEGPAPRETSFIRLKGHQNKGELDTDTYVLEDIGIPASIEIKIVPTVDAGIFTASDDWKAEYIEILRPHEAGSMEATTSRFEVGRNFATSKSSGWINVTKVLNRPAIKATPTGETIKNDVRVAVVHFYPNSTSETVTENQTTEVWTKENTVTITKATSTEFNASVALGYEYDSKVAGKFTAQATAGFAKTMSSEESASQTTSVSKSLSWNLQVPARSSVFRETILRVPEEYTLYMAAGESAVIRKPGGKAEWKTGRNLQIPTTDDAGKTVPVRMSRINEFLRNMDEDSYEMALNTMRDQEWVNQGWVIADVPPVQPGLQPDDVIGTYRYTPYENGWHGGRFTAGPNGTLIWTNDAKVSWTLIPDLQKGMLRTTEDNPYHTQGIRDFKIVIKYGRVAGYIFGIYFSKVLPDPNAASVAVTTSPMPRATPTPAPMPLPMPTPTPAPEVTGKPASAPGNLQVADLLGTYEREPVENAWHRGRITAGPNKTLIWTNSADRSWTITPDLAKGMLRTGADNPYLDQNIIDFTLEIKEAKLIGFRFGARPELYRQTLRDSAPTDPANTPTAPTKPTTPVAVNGMNLISIEKIVQGMLMGHFRQVGQGVWREESAIDDGKREWKEVSRDQNAVYLQDEDAWLRLDLVRKIVFYSTDNFKSEMPLYSIRNAKAAEAISSKPMPNAPVPTPSTPMPGAPQPGEQSSNQQNQGWDVAGFSRASQAALKAVQNVKKNDSPGVYQLRPADHPELGKLGLQTNARISFYRNYGPRQLTFFVASDTDNVLLVFRGTENETQWKLNGMPFKDAKTPDGPALEQMGWGIVEIDCLRSAMPVRRPAYGGQLVHNGWQEGVDGVWSVILKELNEHQSTRKSITVAGHSLGGALAGYSTYRLMQETNVFNPQKPHLLATYAAPHFALRTDDGGRSQDLGELLLNSYETFRTAATRFGSAAVKIKKADIKGGTRDATSAVESILAFKIPRNPSFRANFKEGFLQLAATQAPGMKVFAVEAVGPNGVDLVTVSWDLSGIATSASDMLRKPLADMRSSMTVSVPVIGRVNFSPPGLEGMLNDLIRSLTDLGRLGFGTSEVIGTVINVQTDKTALFDVHDNDQTYFEGLKAMGLVKVTTP